MHSLEYIRRINKEADERYQARLKAIEETNDVETLKKWLKKLAATDRAKLTCRNCGREIWIPASAEE